MASRAERRHPETEQTCDWEPCRAAPGSPCTNRRGDVRPRPHPGRKDAWIRAHFTCPDCTAPAAHYCTANGAPVAQGVCTGRARAAEAAYAQAIEAASRDVR
ncbi:MULTISPECIES: zinc finger domain-containing protein [Streptomyces]|uniref:DNA-binding phage zinc finger domain-containing protein n=1 Tax=Streptomyces doudnae TaxID=3075536 RepID=A0ABD5EN16_9ACTN|nr:MULTISPECIES: hypothetical protein [unclassified Streptomyces]MDT0435678.1 hypothetical protein [Streptomyces sp. DSM 41981]MYQ62632.1 hypothetical protein [Streptomyces sp. SID4950]SCD41102.1 hypothetical protein GA0115242_1048138 [Streptomyces sp. SolWspMP-5a-2]